MKGILLLPFCCFVGSVVAYDSVKVSFPHFYDIPITIKQLKEDHSNEFVRLGSDKDLNATLYSFRNDPRFIILFDSNGNIAGNRVCYTKHDVDQRAKWNNKEFTYYFDKIPSFTSRRYWNTDVWCHDVLFQSPEILKQGGRKDLEWKDIWLKLSTDKFEQIPTDECLLKPLNFTLQNCYYAMGKHFFYQMTPELDCSTWGGVVLMYEYGYMTGMAFAIPGQFSHTDRVWFENATTAVIKDIIATYPPCLIHASDYFGIMDFHIMFHPDPLKIQCMWPWQIPDQCTWR